MKVFNEPVPKNRMRQFHEILIATGGRYISNPRDCGDHFRCDYAPGDHLAQTKAWRVITTGINEVDIRKTAKGRIRRLAWRTLSILGAIGRAWSVRKTPHLVF